MSMCSSSRKSQKGQVSIFIALVFQILFIFFAMVINVGLLVHQKINLQNSVDLAAYYGAMKQAENLNAVAHINYQIRQAWKLLIFRYQQIGSAGDGYVHPWQFSPPPSQARAEDDNKPIGFPGVFCIGYSPFNLYSSGENYCLKASQQIKATTIKAPPRSTYIVGSTFISFDRAIVTLSNQLADLAVKGCKKNAFINWYNLARFISAYRQDLVTRKRNLLLIANGMSKPGQAMLDLDGESVQEGVLTTLKKNLTPENRDGFKDTNFAFSNSLSEGGCGATDNDSPPGWLNDILIAPTFWFVDGTCPDDTDFKFKPRPIAEFGNPNVPEEPELLNTYRDIIDKLKGDLAEPAGQTGIEKIFKSSLGYEKNPWCMAYVKVSAKATPSIPFSPFGNVTLTATAYAKPFGGRIGPWHKKTWSPGAAQSDGGEKIDINAPDRVAPGAFPPDDDQKDVNIWPNHSRFPGDQVGQRSQLVMSQFGKAIHSRGPLSFSWWNDLVDEPILNNGTNGDPLAWDKAGDKAPSMRDLELEAVSPDLFDLTYYSIEPDYYRNYLVRLEKRKDKNNLILRGDLGSRRQSTDLKFKQFSVKDQMAIVADKNTSPMDTDKLAYLVLKWQNLLNSWQGKNQEDYSIDLDRFGKCEIEIPPKEKNERAAPGNCKVGGRVGYSVKLVDEEYLRRSDLNLGGGSSGGAIRNPPPQ